MTKHFGKISLSFVLSLFMVFTLTPSIAFAEEDPAPTPVPDYKICEVQKDGQLVPQAKGATDYRFIGQKMELTIGYQENSKWKEIPADRVQAIEWSADAKYAKANLKEEEGIAAIVSLEAETPEAGTLVKAKLTLKAEPEPEPEPQKMTIQEEPDPVTLELSYKVDIADGYNPNFDKYDEEEVIKIIQDAEKAGTVLDISDGASKKGTVVNNDDYLIYKFIPKKSRYYTFTTTGKDDTAGYLYEYNNLNPISQTPAEGYSGITCELLAENEDVSDGPFVITGGHDAESGQYEYPLSAEETQPGYEPITYYIITKFYKSSKKGDITLTCNKVDSKGVIYDAVLEYYVLDDPESPESPQTKVSVDLAFTADESSSTYVNDNVLPYNFDASSPITVNYLDCNEKKQLFLASVGRNIITSSDGYKYVLNLIQEQPDDTRFEASVFRYGPGKEMVDWEGDTVELEDFVDNQAVLALPRNSVGRIYTLYLDATEGSSLVSATETSEGDSTMELDFTFGNDCQSKDFYVKTADGKVTKKFTVSFEEATKLGIDELFVDYFQGTKEAEQFVSADDIIDKTIEMPIPCWYKGDSESLMKSDIILDGDDADTKCSFSDTEAMNCIQQAITEGKAVEYRFTVADKISPTKYSAEYTMVFKPTIGKTAGVSKSYVQWLDPKTSELCTQAAPFLTGSGTKSSPYKATVVMPKGVSITNEDCFVQYCAISKELGEVYSYDGERYVKEGNFMDGFLDGLSKSETVKFKVISANGNIVKYYAVKVYDYNKALTKGTVVAAGDATYKVTATGKSAAVTYKRAPGAVDTANVPGTVQIGITKYKVTAVGTGAYKGRTQVKNVTVGSNVKTIGAKAFSGAKNLKTLKVSTTKLTKKGVKKSLTGSSIKTVKLVNKAATKAKVKTYKTYFTKSNCGRKVTVKK